MDIPTQTPPPTDEYVYRTVKPGASNIGWKYVGAGILALLGILDFIGACFTRVNTVVLTCGTTLPLLLAAQLFWQARTGETTPLEVVANREGLRIVRARKTDSYAWNRIAIAMAGKNGLTGRRELALFDTSGKSIAKLDDSIQYFDHLSSVIDYSISGQSDAVAQPIRLRKARRNSVFYIIFGVLFLSLSIAGVFFTVGDQRAANLMRTSAVPGTGTITRRYLAPNGVTCRLEYSVTAPSGKTGTHDAEISRDYWDSLAGVKTVPIVYVPSDPDVSRLASGEIPDDSQLDPPVMFLMCLLMGSIAVFVIVAGVLLWNGNEIYRNKVTGKLGLKRYGEPMPDAATFM